MARNALFSGWYNYTEKISARASRSHIKVVLEGEEVKIIISWDLKRGHQMRHFFLATVLKKKIRSRFAIAY